jgi:hypothetical protein
MAIDVSTLFGAVRKVNIPKRGLTTFVQKPVGLFEINAEERARNMFERMTTGHYPTFYGRPVREYLFRGVSGKWSFTMFFRPGVQATSDKYASRADALKALRQFIGRATSATCLNPDFSTDELIWDSWARGLDHDQVQQELRELRRKVTLKHIAAEYGRHDTEYMARHSTGDWVPVGSSLFKNKAHLFA